MPSYSESSAAHSTRGAGSCGGGQPVHIVGGGGRCCRPDCCRVCCLSDRESTGRRFLRHLELAETIRLRGVEVGVVWRRCRSALMGLPLGVHLIPLVVVFRIAAILIKIGSCRVQPPPKAHSMEEMKSSNRGQNRLFYCCVPVPVLNFQELQQRLNMRGIDHTANANRPREDMDYPPLVRIIAQGFQKRQICLLFPHSCSEQLSRVHVRRAAEINNGDSFMMLRYQDPVRLSPAPLFSCGVGGRTEY